MQEQVSKGNRRETWVLVLRIIVKSLASTSLKHQAYDPITPL